MDAGERTASMCGDEGEVPPLQQRGQPEDPAPGSALPPTTDDSAATAALWRAVRRGDIQGVVDAADRGADLHAEARGFLPLAYAVCLIVLFSAKGRLRVDAAPDGM